MSTTRTSPSGGNRGRGPRLSRSCALVMVLVLVLGAQATHAALGLPAQRSRVSLAVRPIKQPYMLCLVASVSMVLSYWGSDLAPETLAEQVPIYKDGTAGQDLVPLVEALGFHGFLIQPSFEDLLGHLEKGRPVIVTLPEPGRTARHALVLTGFDMTDRSVLLNDPATGKSTSIRMDTFQERWEDGRRWTLLIVPKQAVPIQ